MGLYIFMIEFSVFWHTHFESTRLDITPQMEKLIKTRPLGTGIGVFVLIICEKRERERERERENSLSFFFSITLNRTSHKNNYQHFKKKLL